MEIIKVKQIEIYSNIHYTQIYNTNYFLKYLVFNYVPKVFKMTVINT